MLTATLFITRLVQSVPSHCESTDPNCAKFAFFEEDVREEHETELRRETVADNGRATGHLLRGTPHPLTSNRSPAPLLLVCWSLLIETLVRQVVSHLHPKDLLQLSRSSRQLHSLLMTSYATPYWRAARRGIKLPDGPPAINEAQYASLMFEHRCTVSTRARLRKLFQARESDLVCSRRVAPRIRSSDLPKHTPSSAMSAIHSSAL
jgi:hypothetical protein